MARKALPPRLVESGGVWYVIYSDAGRSQRASLRTEDIQVAQERFQGWLKARQDDVLAHVPQTFASACRMYLEQHGPTVSSPETLAHVLKCLVIRFGDRNLSQITRADVELYTKDRLSGVIKKRKVSNATVRKELGIMRAVFNFMVKRVEPKELRVDFKDLSYIPLPPKPPARDRVLSSEELELIRISNKIPDNGERMSRISRYLWLLMETGARAEALRSLTWAQIDFDNGIIRLNPWGRNQTTKRRPTIPMSDDLILVLKHAKAEATSDWVIDHRGQIRKSMERFCETHRLSKVTAHTFRHTLATRLAQANVSMTEIAAMLGDSIATVEKNYLHISPQFLRGALQKLKAL
jgi:integrase